MYTQSEIVFLAERYARARKISLTTLSRWANGSHTWLDRCKTGRVTFRSAFAYIQWLSDQWPEGLLWPGDIPRPDPAPDSPAGAFYKEQEGEDDALAAFEATRRRFHAAAKGGDPKAARRAKSEMYAAGMQLGPSGEIASRAALCRALGVQPSVYYAVVRRYRDGVGEERWPRAGSDSDRMLIALSASGDVRFASRRAEAVA